MIKSAKKHLNVKERDLNTEKRIREGTHVHSRDWKWIGWLVRSRTVALLSEHEAANLHKKLTASAHTASRLRRTLMNRAVLR